MSTQYCKIATLTFKFSLIKLVYVESCSRTCLVPIYADLHELHSDYLLSGHLNSLLCQCLNEFTYNSKLKYVKYSYLLWLPKRFKDNKNSKSLDIKYDALVMIPQ